MADQMKNNKTKKLFIDLSLFTFTTQTTSTAKSSIKSPRNFEEPNGVVGLGILAALNDDEYCSQDPFFKRSAILAVSPRLSSNPIPILQKLTSLSSSAAAAANNSSPRTNDMNKRRLRIEEMELCEEYTCVISHVGSNQIKKKEYFDNSNIVVVSKAENISANSNSNIGHWVSSGVVSTVSSAVNHSHGGEIAAAAEAFPFAEFLNSCYLCKKHLHGLDIFMYRGEKAFCSAECRYKQISMDEHKEKYVSGTMKSLEYSASPCSGPMQFLAGVAAA